MIIPHALQSGLMQNLNFGMIASGISGEATGVMLIATGRRQDG